MSINSFEANYLLKKHVNAVHCSNTMTLLQRKAANVLLANAYNDLLDKDYFYIDVKTLCVLMGFNSKNFYKLKDSLKGLVSTVVEWGILDKNSDINDSHWGASSLLAAIDIKDGQCKYEYSNTMKKLLYYPDVFANINLKVQSQFKSSYALALYENCSRYKNVKQTPWLQLHEAKRILGAFGKVYEHYGSFKKRVLDIAVDEVNEKADFQVNLVLKKEGRSVVAVKFEIIPDVSRVKDTDKQQGTQESPDMSALVKTKLVNEFKVSASIVDKLINEHGAQYIEQKITQLTSLSSYKSGQIKNIAGALVDRINNPEKYIESQTSQKNIEESQRTKLGRGLKARKKQLEQDKLTKEYLKYIEHKVSTYLSLQAQEDNDFIKQEFCKFCAKSNHNFILAKISRNDYSSPMVKVVYNKFVVDNYLKDRVMSKQEFAKNG